MRAVNLIPSEARGDAGLGGGRSGGGAYAVLGLLAGLTLLALLYGIAHHKVSSRRSELASINARVQRASESSGHLAQYQSFLALREERMHAVTQLASSRFAWAHALYELGRVLPLGVSVSSLDGTVGSGSVGSASTPSSAGSASTPSSASSGSKASGAVTSATPPGSVPSFTLTGCATSQETVAVVLNRLSLIHGVAEATLQASTAASAGSSASAGSASGNCPAGASTFTVLVTYQPLPGAASTSAPSSSSPTSDASSPILKKAQSTGGAG